jgi:hypothetical protein
MGEAESTAVLAPASSRKVNLATRLGITAHQSLLLHRLRGRGLDTPEKLAALAESRGLDYYAGTRPAPIPSATLTAADVTTEELAIALLHPCLPWEPQRIRLAAALLAAPEVRASTVARLAIMERCAAVVREIARAGQTEEPSNSFWPSLLDLLPPGPSVPSGVLPHRSRYMAITGRARPGTIPARKWVRPIPG